MITAVDALVAQLGASAGLTEMKGWLTDYENQMKYAKDALVLATMAGAADSDAAFSTAGAVIGMCIYQPVTSETATCWGYTA